MRRFVVRLTMCHFVLVFFSPFSIAITSLGEEKPNLSAFCMFVWFVLVWICWFPFSSWCLGRAVVCDCGTPWTFLLPFFFFLILVAPLCPTQVWFPHLLKLVSADSNILPKVDNLLYLYKKKQSSSVNNYEDGGFQVIGKYLTCAGVST